MDKTIVLECQTKVVSCNCQDCIVFKECTLSKKNDEIIIDTVIAENMKTFVCHV